ncbi:MAG TPA: hypothetical protein VHN37_15700, partial [Actinomycetota bacterium]|nr:hypothetical protein [Actinomycetota bacterium]
LLAGAGGAAIFFDREEARFGPRARLFPSFSAGYACTDARDQLSEETLVYRLRYDGDRWLAEVALSVLTGDLREPCEVRLGVPPRSDDASPRNGDGARLVSLRRDGSRSSGTATAEVRPGEDGEYLLAVVLPRDFEMFHSVGLGRYFFRFSFFAPGEGASFKTGRVEVHVPDGYTFVEAIPAAGSTAPSVTSRAWTLKADRDVETRVTFEHDALRDAVDLAPEAVLVALGGLIALLLAPSRRELPAEAPEATHKRTEPVPVEAARPVAEIAPEPAPEPAPSPVAGEREPAPEPLPTPAISETPAGPEPVPLPAYVPPRPSRPAPPIPAPAERTRAAAARAARYGLAAVAAAFFVRLLRSRRARRR